MQVNSPSSRADFLTAASVEITPERIVDFLWPIASQGMDRDVEILAVAHQFIGASQGLTEEGFAEFKWEVTAYARYLRRAFGLGQSPGSPSIFGMLDRSMVRVLRALHRTESHGTVNRKS